MGAPVFVSEREPSLQKLSATEDRAAIRVGARPVTHIQRASLQKLSATERCVATRVDARLTEIEQHRPGTVQQV